MTLEDSDCKQEWTTLSALLQQTGGMGPSAAYLQLEQELLDMVVQFLRIYGDLLLRYRCCYLTDDDLFGVKDQGWLPDVLLPLHGTVTLLQTRRFEELRSIEHRAVIQLAVRGAAHVAIEDPAAGVVLSTVGDGFCWYVAILDDTEIEMVVRSSRPCINDAIDISDAA